MYKIIQRAYWGGLNGTELEFSNRDSSTSQHICNCLAFSLADLDCFNRSGWKEYSQTHRVHLIVLTPFLNHGPGAPPTWLMKSNKGHIQNVQC